MIKNEELEGGRKLGSIVFRELGEESVVRRSKELLVVLIVVYRFR